MNLTLAGFTLAFAAGICVRPVQAQTRPYIGFVYPAGGQQGTTFHIRLGGQGLDGVHAMIVTGSGVTAKVIDYQRRLNNEELQVLRDQVKELKGAAGQESRVTRIEQRIADFVQTPACAAIATLTIVEVTVAIDAEPGRREIRLITSRGVSNPLAFHVGQVREFSRKPMLTATIQVLGKEARALRQRPTNEIEARIELPCTVNGQIAAGEMNRYRFQARKGQRLVISTLARQLIPFIADAVPGWFQPVVTVYNANGRELAFSDDYRFQPDPVMLFEVPNDGEYVFAITDALYRGREDFVYRVTVGELPFLTGIFPLGARSGVPVSPSITGWNVENALLVPPAKDAKPGVYSLTAAVNGIVSNPLPFVIDELPEASESEPNNSASSAQTVTLPVIVNGRILKSDDWDVFQFTARSEDTIVAEVHARRLASPLDSIIKLTDGAGHLLAFSDDREDLAAGINTHHADSSFITTLPADGTYFLHIGDTARQGGPDYAYRLRLGAPRPDFDLWVTPSSLRIRTNSSAPVTVYAQRKDGFTGSIRLELKDAPAVFSAAPVNLATGQNSAVLNIKGPPNAMNNRISLKIIGTAKVSWNDELYESHSGEQTIVREAVAADDQMQAFLWRHLVPATKLAVLTYDPAYEPPPKRVPPTRPASLVAVNTTNSPTGTNTAVASPKFTKQQIARRLRELQRLYEEDFLTDEFYQARLAECETAQ